MSATEPEWSAPTWGDRFVALGIFAVTLALLLATMDMGITRDESFYFHAARDYIGWFEELQKSWGAGQLSQSFTQESVDRHWGYNPEHPALMKTLFALSHALFHRHLGWASEITAMRLPTAALSAWLVSMVYLFGRQLFGRGAGLIGAGALLLQPRFFFHAHMAAFDTAMAAMWFAVIWAYWRSWGSRGWAIACGVLWGLALATKLNAFFLPVVLVAHWALVSWRGFGVSRREEGLALRWPAMPWALVAMALLGPLIFYLHWPRIWFDTFERVRWYMAFHLEHVHYFVRYFGEPLYTPPFPRSFPWVMTLVTVPATVLGAAAVGLRRWWVERGVSGRLGQWARALRARELPAPSADARGTGLLLALATLFPIWLIGRPETPIFGGVKHWLPANPYVAMLAGAGAAWAGAQAVAWWERRRGERAPWARAGALALAAGLVWGPAAGELAGNHPDGTAYYNEVIGSHRGAADREMMRQFWGYASRQGLDWLNANAPKGARVWTHNTTQWAWQDYERAGLAREDLRASSMHASDLALFHHQAAFVHKRQELWRTYGVRAPVWVYARDGVPILSIYARDPEAFAPAAPKK